MDERKACALLKHRFEEAGFKIAENISFDENGVRFEIDGFDAERRVGYEYVTREAGDDWDVDGAVIEALAQRRKAGELYVLVVDEADAPDEAGLSAAIEEFFDELREEDVIKSAAKKPAARKKTATKKPATKKK